MKPGYLQSVYRMVWSPKILSGRIGTTYDEDFYVNTRKGFKNYVQSEYCDTCNMLITKIVTPKK